MKRDTNNFSPIYFKAPDDLLDFFRKLAKKENKLLRGCIIEALEQYRKEVEFTMDNMSDIFE